MYSIISTPSLDDQLNYITEAQLRDLDIDPDSIRVFCPWAVELGTLGGSRCWSIADLASLLGGGGT